MQLPIKNLKEFCSLSKHIDSEKLDLRPILKFIKLEVEFDELTITRDNSYEFLIHKSTVNCEDCIFLLPYSEFYEFVSSSKGEFLDIAINSGNVTVYDGYGKQKWNVSGISISDFPELIQVGSNWFELTTQMIQILNLSKNITKKNDSVRPYMAYSHVGKEAIYSSDYNLFFKKDLLLDLPFDSIPVSLKEAICINQFDKVSYTFSNPHNVWRNANTMYGFRQADGAAEGFNYKQFFHGIEIGAKPYISLNIDDVINFCVSTKKFRKSLISNCTFSSANGIALLKYIDKSTEGENELPIRCSGAEFDFIFNSDMVLSAIENFPYDRISICKEQLELNNVKRDIAYLFSEDDKSICIVLPTLGKEAL